MYINDNILYLMKIYLKLFCGFKKYPDICSVQQRVAGTNLLTKVGIFCIINYEFS